MRHLFPAVSIRYDLGYNLFPTSFFFFLSLISFSVEKRCERYEVETQRERERKKIEGRIPRVEVSANICHSCAGIVTPPILHSLSSVGLVTIARIDSSDGKLPTGLAWLEFLGAKMEIVSIFPFETGFLIWKGLLMGPVFQLSPPLIDWFVP